MRILSPNFILLLLLSAATHHLVAQDSDTIPFILTEHNNILVEAIVNDIDTLQLMLHTAVNDVSIIESTSKKMKSFKVDGVHSVESWGGEAESAHSSNNKLSIGDYEWQELTIWQGKHSGHFSDGKFGINLFDAKAVELNFDLKVMVLHDDISDYSDAYHVISIDNRNGVFFIEGDFSIDAEGYSNSFLLHTGYSGTILLDDAFVGEHRIGEKLEALDESVLKDSFGNELRTIHSVLPNFELGDITFEQVPVGFFEGEIKRQAMSVLGADILRRFNLIFNKDRTLLYARPNELFHSPFEKS